MGEREDGGPAFPQQCADALDVGMVHEGMMLRDWFAGRALTYLAGRDDMEIADADDLAGKAYVLADAMLEARKK